MSHFQASLRYVAEAESTMQLRNPRIQTFASIWPNQNTLTIITPRTMESIYLTFKHQFLQHRETKSINAMQEIAVVCNENVTKHENTKCGHNSYF